MGEIHELSFWPFLWFGLPGRLPNLAKRLRDLGACFPDEKDRVLSEREREREREGEKKRKRQRESDRKRDRQREIKQMNERKTHRPLSSGTEKQPKHEVFGRDIPRTSVGYPGGRPDPKTFSPSPGAQENKVFSTDVHDPKPQGEDVHDPRGSQIKCMQENFG